MESCSLVCVESPGMVNNPDKLIEMMGGLRNVCSVLAEPNLRLELRFRPDDPYSKPTCGERSSDVSFVIRVKRLRHKAHPDRVKVLPEIVSIVDTTFKFHNLCDFQYLPVLTDPDDASKSRSIVSCTSLNQLESVEWLSRDLEKTPLFLPPAAFSRMDTPQDYHYRREQSGSAGLSSLPKNIIGRTRQRRSLHAVFVSYDCRPAPVKPHDMAVKQLRIGFVDTAEINLVKQRLVEQPVWSKSYLTFVTKVSPARMKLILPTLAYYFTTGPWRNLWVRFGYDPRLDAGAAMFQSLDYRVRIEGGAVHRIKAKRNYANYLLPYKAVSLPRPKTSMIKCEFNENEARSKKAASTDAPDDAPNPFVFRPGTMPPSRQMFYLFKDLLVDEAQEVISRCRRQEDCDEKNGWFAPGTDAKLRDILTKEINVFIRSQNRHKPIQGEEAPQEDEEEEEDEEEDEEEEEDEGEDDSP